jgi:hypothetical protein
MANLALRTYDEAATRLSVGSPFGPTVGSLGRGCARHDTWSCGSDAVHPPGTVSGRLEVVVGEACSGEGPGTQALECLWCCAS